MSQRKILMDNFALRQFKKDSSGIFINFDPKEFEKIVNDHYVKNLNEGINILKPGYAPFCKHIFIKNFISDLTPSAIEISDNVKHLIKTTYEARTEKELPVLRRYINITDVKDKLNPAVFLDVILYSKEQITLEDQSMGNEDCSNSDYDYGIISIKPQNQDIELPMDPITMMRNALGKEEGGSGVKLDRQKYLESVSYWENNILLK